MMGGLLRMMVAMALLAAASQASLYNFDTFTFTSCGRPAHPGPTNADCASFYGALATPPDFLSSSSFYNVSFTGIQSLQVPQTGLYQLTVAGSRGGSCNGGTGSGQGGVICAIAKFNEGDYIDIVVGQPGSDGPYPCTQRTGGGGGLSGVFFLDKAAQRRSPIVIAGGGGGAGATCNIPADGINPNIPEGPGPFDGRPANDPNSPRAVATNGKGGNCEWPTGGGGAGGGGGDGTFSVTFEGGARKLLTSALGGFGGGGTGCANDGAATHPGAGGGGGWVGGEGGDSTNGGNGGGGMGYYSRGVTKAGYNFNNAPGYVTLTYLDPSASTPATVCVPDSTPLSAGTCYDPSATPDPPLPPGFQAITTSGYNSVVTSLNAAQTTVNAMTTSVAAITSTASVVTGAVNSITSSQNSASTSQNSASTSAQSIASSTAYNSATSTNSRSTSTSVRSATTSAYSTSTAARSTTTGSYSTSTAARSSTTSGRATSTAARSSTTSVHSSTTSAHAATGSAGH